MKIAKFNYKPSFFEKNAWKKNLLVCGIDEVGRGCLAGPLVVSAVILPQNTRYKLLKDSKTLSEQEREQAHAWITQNCLFSTVTTSWHEIDRLNIYQATIRTMKRAYIELLAQKGIPSKIPNKMEDHKLKYVLTDAMPIRLAPPFTQEGLEIYSFPKGESISPSIAAASIVAKVTRDRLMERISTFFPAFELNRHKGYGTSLHWSRINKYGKTILHRKTFAKPGKLGEEKSQKSFLE